MASNFDQKTQLESNNTVQNSNANGGGKFFWYLLFILIIPIFVHIGKRNWFRRTKEEALEQLSNIDAKLTQRFNTLENQLSTAKAALAQEKDIFTEVARVRSQATAKQTSPEAIVEKNQMVNQAAGRFSAVLENYPQLQTMPVMQQLMQTVKDLERDLEANRRFYTAVIRKYNSRLLTYPGNVAAASIKATRMPMFEAEDGKRADFKLTF